MGIEGISSKTQGRLETAKQDNDLMVQQEVEELSRLCGLLEQRASEWTEAYDQVRVMARAATRA